MSKLDALKSSKLKARLQPCARVYRSDTNKMQAANKGYRVPFAQDRTSDVALWSSVGLPGYELRSIIAGGLRQRYGLVDPFKDDTFL